MDWADRDDRVEYPAGTVTTLQSNDHVDVEADQEVKTQ